MKAKATKSSFNYHLVGACIGVSLVWIAVIKMFFYQEDTSRQSVCADFVNKYFASIRAEHGGSFEQYPERWETAVDIETDMYNLCVADPSETALKDYQSTVMRKYASQD